MQVTQRKLYDLNNKYYIPEQTFMLRSSNRAPILF